MKNPSKLKLYRVLLAFVAICLGVTHSYTASAACSHPSLGQLYSEATHPHAYYRICNSCSAKVYTGGYATKNHGNGAWGSGTCPSCGVHTFIGGSCTSPATCACGATQSPRGHVWGGIYSEVSHPHPWYQECRICGIKRLTGGYETKLHGNGAWGSGTCPECGIHNFEPDFSNGREHPHAGYMKCACGAVELLGYAVFPECISCMRGSKTVNIHEQKPMVVATVDGEIGVGGVPIVIGFKADISYTEVYKRDEYGFVSLSTTLSTRGYAIPAPYHNYITVGACAERPYYDNAGTNIFTETFYIAGTIINPLPGEAYGKPFRNNLIPAYSKANVYASMPSAIINYTETGIEVFYNY